MRVMTKFKFYFYFCRTNPRMHTKFRVLKWQDLLQSKMRWPMYSRFLWS